MYHSIVKVLYKWLWVLPSSCYSQGQIYTFRHFGKMATLECWLRRVCPSVCPSVRLSYWADLRETLCSGF